MIDKSDTQSRRETTMVARIGVQHGTHPAPKTPAIAHGLEVDAHAWILSPKSLDHPPHVRSAFPRRNHSVQCGVVDGEFDQNHIGAIVIDALNVLQAPARGRTGTRAIMDDHGSRCTIHQSPLERRLPSAAGRQARAVGRDDQRRCVPDRRSVSHRVMRPQRQAGQHACEAELLCGRPEMHQQRGPLSDERGMRNDYGTWRP